jgi:PAS domain S-box-containing protein
MSQDKIDILQRALAREKAARKAAESILEEKSAELYELTQNLKESNAKLETLIKEKTTELKGVFENIADAYVVMDLKGNVLKMNDAAMDLLGYNFKKEAINLMILPHPDEIENVTNSFQKLYAEGILKDLNLKILTKNKEQKLIHINASLIYDESGKPIAAQGIIRDITKDKEAEEELIESESRLASLILNLDIAVLLENEERKIVLTNSRFCNFFEIPVLPEQLIGMDCSNSAEQSKHLFQDPESFVNSISKILEKKETVLGEELTMTNGKILERDYIPIFRNNEYKGHLWSYKDVTLQKKYEKSLKAQKEKYSSIIANMNLGLVEVNNDDEILMTNQSFHEMSGYSEKELLGKVASKILLIDNGPKIIKNENEKRKKGISNSYEIKVKNKAGELRQWLISGAPNYDFNGNVVGSIGIHLDITDLKNLEIQKEKLLKDLERSNDELQEYAHIVSHDLKSPLRSINALVSWLKEDNIDKLDKASLKNIGLIEITLEKMEKLISDVLEYSSIGSTIKKEYFDLNEVITEIKSIILIPDHFSINLIKPLPKIKGDKSKLVQLFQNLVSNAIRYNDKEIGIIEIDYKDNKAHFEFSIKDNGIGIEEKYYKKIFETFHSLHKSKDSTGIGLSIVKKIVNLHKGEVWVKSTEGVGTTFYFTLKK